MDGAAVLLDTCVIIWIAAGARLSVPATDAIDRAVRASVVLVSPVSAWEIGLLARRGRGPSGTQFVPDPKSWFATFMTGAGVRLAPFTPDMAIDSSGLPGSLHDDPADRMIVSTARHLGVPVVTRDRRIVAYGLEGHVTVIPC